MTHLRVLAPVRVADAELGPHGFPVLLERLDLRVLEQVDRITVGLDHQEVDVGESDGSDLLLGHLPVRVTDTGILVEVRVVDLAQELVVRLGVASFFDVVGHQKGVLLHDVRILSMVE
ncbi:hypothetical protein [Nocardioides sp. WS12]|uniref:hypothetical protein n=1 Tax=Nocardioides sp. WS12 TaxID=2486272 RepID=UPI0015FD7984|nr:hypothetical protein [Nocardioides sp. WS12]